MTLLLINNAAGYRHLPSPGTAGIAPHTDSSRCHAKAGGGWTGGTCRGWKNSTTGTVTSVTSRKINQIHPIGDDEKARKRHG